MALTVLSVAFPFAPVGPHAVGGAEHVLNLLDRAIVASGNTSLVVARSDSEPRGTLFAVELPKTVELDMSSKVWARERVQAAIDRALVTYCVDLIHIHAMDFHDYVVPPEIPVLVTLHLPFAWYPKRIWDELAPNIQICCVSESQRRTGPAQLQDAPIIQNGVLLPETPARRAGNSFALVLGRICPEKNAHEALIAGSRAGIPVLVAGQIFPFRAHLEYFHEKVEPLLEKGGVRHEFLGPVDRPKKNTLLSQAKCLLHPTRAPETSSLVAMEAMAVGTPVIAYRSGALNEIVEDEVTGFLVNDVEEMAQAIAKADTISAEVCRRVAEQRFDSTRMVRQYFEMYDSLLCKNRAKRCYV